MEVADPLAHLARAAMEGDDVAVASLVRATQPAVWRLCRALGSPDNVDDLTQDTYLRALRALPMFRFETGVQVWMLSIARRVCADDIRRRQRSRRLLDRMRCNQIDATVPLPGRIDDLLDDLDDDRREAFVLTQLLGLSYEEAAAVAGCPVGTIRSRVARARAELLDAVQRAEAR